MDMLNYETQKWLYLYIQWTDPNWWIVTSILVLFMSAIGMTPFHVSYASTWTETILINIRRALAYSSFIWVILIPIFVLAFYRYPNADIWQSQKILLVHYFSTMFPSLLLPIVAIILGLLFRAAYFRLFIRGVSGGLRKLRARQTHDHQSDVKKEIKRLQSKDFNPIKYYKPKKIFLGLNQKNKPVYMPAESFFSQHLEILGPTGFGKGTVAGVLIEQCILEGNTTFVIDPKGDEYMPQIMAQAAKRAGRKFIYLDLSTGQNGRWAPFSGGTLRQQRSRLLYIYSMEEKGEQADYYRRQERALLDEILEKGRGRIGGLLEQIRALPKADKERMTGIESGLEEWSKIDSLNPRPGRGFSIEKSLLDDAVVYVHASMTDRLVKDASKVFIMELFQEAERLFGARQSRISLFVDEVRFLVSDQLVNALATTRAWNMNVMLAYQSLGDLQNLDDKRLSAYSIDKAIHTNCQSKIIYGGLDYDTAEWASKLAGEQQLQVAKLERTDIEQFGTETWGKSRFLQDTSAPYLHPNILLTSPKRVAIFLSPGELAQVIFTAWVPIKKNSEFKQYSRPPAQLIEPKNTETSEEKNNSPNIISDIASI